MRDGPCVAPREGGDVEIPRIVWALVLGVGLPSCGESSQALDAQADGASADVVPDAPSGVACPITPVGLQGDPDAGTGDIDRSCLGALSPLTCQRLHVCGRTRGLLLPLTVGDVTVTLFDAQEQRLTEVVTDSDGTYCVDVPVGAQGFLGRFVYAREGYFTHDGYVTGRPWRESREHVDVGLERASALNATLQSLNLPPQDDAKGITDPFLVDCAGGWTAGITVEIDRPYGQRLYLDASGSPDPMATRTSRTSVTGALFLNVEPGPVEATFRRAPVDGGVGEVVARARGVIRPRHWTALIAAPDPLP